MTTKDFVINDELFAARLKEARHDMGLSQAAIAKKCGVSRETFNRYESGKLKPGMDVLAILAVNGADIEYILTGNKVKNFKPLTPREAALLKKYRSANDAGKRIIEATAFLVATIIQTTNPQA
jgi:transcriptional regulator with XRE-family HTH domain